MRCKHEGHRFVGRFWVWGMAHQAGQSPDGDGCIYRPDCGLLWDSDLERSDPLGFLANCPTRPTNDFPGLNSDVSLRALAFWAAGHGFIPFLRLWRWLLSNV